MRTKQFIYFILLSGLAFWGCGPGQGDKNDDKTDTIKDTVAVAPLAYDTVLDNRLAFIAGMTHGNGECYKTLDVSTKWKSYSKEMDSMFTRVDTNRLQKMQTWADQQLVLRETDTTVFYPFAGPDFLSAHTMYPNARNYIMIALEPIGELPEVCNMKPEVLNKYMGDIKYSLSDILRRSYFITLNMMSDLRKEEVDGAIHLITLFIKRTGHHVISIRPVVVDSAGKIQDGLKLKEAKGTTPGIQIDFVNEGGDKLQTVYYFKTDLSDNGLNKNAGFMKYMDALPLCVTYLKAASYLMHTPEFSVIRNKVFDKSLSILQDDSGIAFRFFDSKKWDLRLFGDYQGPIKQFEWIKEPDLLQAHKDSVDRPFAFTTGYKWSTEHMSMTYAVKKGVLKLKDDHIK